MNFELSKANTPRKGKKDQHIPIREINLTNKEGIGLQDIPYQVVKKHFSQGFTFNIMCIGETGIGKSTLINTLFGTKIDNIDIQQKQNIHSHPKVTLRSEKYNLEEKGVLVDLTVVETVGYGDQIQREWSYEPILGHIDTQFDKYLEEELNPERQLDLMQDTRIHVCLYFICPTGHKLKSLDLLCLKQLCKKINVIPVIAKSDALSKDDLNAFKLNIKMELEKETVEIYRFPTEEDEAAEEFNSKLNSMMPFAVVGSNDFVLRDGALVRGRNYPWGIVFVMNENHSDTSTLQKGMIETNLVDLKEQTHRKHYENYRKNRMSSVEDISEHQVMDAFKLRTGEVQNEFQRQESKLIQDYVEKAKRFELALLQEEKAMRDKYRCMELDALEEKKKLEEDARLLDLEIEDFRRFAEEKKFAKGDDECSLI